MGQEFVIQICRTYSKMCPFSAERRTEQFLMFDFYFRAKLIKSSGILHRLRSPNG